MREQNHFVDAGCCQGIHGLLDFRRKGVEIRGISRADYDVRTRRGNGRQCGGGRADDTDGLAVDINRHITGNLAGHCRRDRAVGAHQWAEIRIGGKVQVRRQVGKSGARIITLGGKQSGDLIRAIVELMVTEGTGLYAHRIEEEDVTATRRRHAQQIDHAVVITGRIQGAGDVVVTRGQHQGIVRVFVAEFL